MNLKNKKIAVIGCGNMASAIVKGFYQKEKSVQFFTYTPSRTKAQELANSVKGQVLLSLSELKDHSFDSLMIACKPQQLSDLAQNIKNEKINLAQFHIISILAGTSLDTLSQKLESKQITRVMPNTPAALGLGVSLVIHSRDVTDDNKEFVDYFFKSCGLVQDLESEELFDKVTTVSGSGPAYVYLFAKTMSDQLEKWGLDQKDARNIVVELFRGSAQMMLNENDLSLDELIAKVTSKGGVTIEAIKSYKNDHIELMTEKALLKAYERSCEISKLVSLSGHGS